MVTRGDRPSTHSSRFNTSSDEPLVFQHNVCRLDNDCRLNLDYHEISDFFVQIVKRIPANCCDTSTYSLSRVQQPSGDHALIAYQLTTQSRDRHMMVTRRTGRRSSSLNMNSCTTYTQKVCRKPMQLLMKHGNIK